MSPDDLKSSTYTDFDKENNKEDPKFKALEHVRISKYNNIFAKRLRSTQEWRRFCD